jgi:hypothetical protein
LTGSSEGRIGGQVRGSWLLLTPLLLGGCLPPAIAVASYAVDGVSYVASGKSLSDHGISVAADKDCATWHFFVGRAVCEDANHPDPAAPFVQRAGRKSTEVAVAASPTGRYDLVIGSFSDRENAVRLARRYARFGARIVKIRVGGHEFARVLIGPLDPGRIAVLRAQGVAGFVAPAAGVMTVARLDRSEAPRD